MANKAKKQQQSEKKPEGEKLHNNKHKETKKEKPVERKKGRGFFGTIFRWIFLITITLLAASTITIGMNCVNGGKQVPGSQPLCKDLTKLSQFTKPSPKFVENVLVTYVTVLRGYRSRVNSLYADFSRTSYGQKFNQVMHMVHAKVVEYSLLAYRYAQQAYDSVQKWYARDGHKLIGPVIEYITIGAKIAWEVIKDFSIMAVEGFKLFVVRVEHFIADVSDLGFSKAFERAIQH